MQLYTFIPSKNYQYCETEIVCYEKDDKKASKVPCWSG